jgi:hypothetical protein
VRFFHSLNETEQRLREGAHPRYQLEIGLVKLIELRRLAPVSQIIERLNALEETLRTGKLPAANTQTPTGGTAGGASGGTSSRGGGAGTPPASRTPKSRAESHAPQSAMKSANADHDPANDDNSPDDTPPWESTPRAVPTTANAPQSISNAPSSVSKAPSSSSSVPSPSTSASSSTSAAATPALRLVEPAQGSTSEPARDDAEGFSLVSAQAPPRVEFEPRASAPAQDSFVERLKHALEDRRKPFLATALDGARKVELRGGAELFIEFATDAKFMRDNLSKPENARLVREACSEIAGREVGLQIVMRDAQESAEAAAEDDERHERERLRELAERDPQVQDVLRIFRAEIVDVRPADKAQ